MLREREAAERDDVESDCVAGYALPSMASSPITSPWQMEPEHALVTLAIDNVRLYGTSADGSDRVEWIALAEHVIVGT